MDSRRRPVVVTGRCPPELEGRSVERTEEPSLGGLVVTSSPTTGHTVSGAMLAFVDDYITLECRVQYGLSNCRSLVWSEIGQRIYAEINNRISLDWPLICVRKADRQTLKGRTNSGRISRSALFVLLGSCTLTRIRSNPMSGSVSLDSDKERHSIATAPSETL